MLDTVDANIECRSPMSKWHRHTAVHTLDDLQSLVKMHLKECQLLQVKKCIEDGEDLTDWLSGKSSVYTEVLENIAQIKEKQTPPSAADTEAGE